jgi:hypothetical protein
MRHIVRACVLLGLIMFAPARAQAGLIGDSVLAALVATQGAVGMPFAGAAVVGPGIEFQGQWLFPPFQQAWDLTVDLADTTVTVTANENTAGANNIHGGALFSINLSSLDLGTPILGVTQVAGGAGVHSIGFTADTISLTWSSLPFGGGNQLPTGGAWTFAIAQAPVDPTNPIPEPATALLMGAAGAVAAIRRRRCK